MKICYYFDESRKKVCNSAGLDYTPAYIPVMLKTAGLTGSPVSASGVRELSAGDVLIIGAETLDPNAAENIKKAAGRGCRIIGFGTEAPELFPETEPFEPGGGAYDVSGYFRYSDSVSLPVIGRVAAIKNAPVLGTFESLNGCAVPAYSADGGVYYYSFDLPLTLWHAADGRPTYEPRQDFVPFGRVPDGCVLPDDYDFDVPYADEYMKRVCDAVGFPRVFELPADNDDIYDFSLYFAGDDDAGSADNDIYAAREMAKRGLPYHINLMPANDEGDFVINRDQYEYLGSIGCETDLHFDFTRFEYSEDGYKKQAGMYERAFGNKPVCPVNHCLIQAGEAADRYRYQSACKAISDNNRFQTKPDKNNINAFNLTGFASGTSYPRFVLDNAAHGNAPIPFCEINNSYYEPRIYTGAPEEYEKLEKYLDAGSDRAMTLQLFLHPHYISGKIGFDPSPALRALDHALAYIRNKKMKVWFTAPQALSKWWHSRAECAITDVENNGFVFDNRTGRQAAVVLPCRVNTVFVNNENDRIIKKRGVCYVPLGPGRSEVKYE